MIYRPNVTSSGGRRSRPRARFSSTCCRANPAANIAGIASAGRKGLEGWQAALAVTAAIVAIFGIVGALVTTMKLAAESTITVADLKQPVDQVPAGPLRDAIMATKADPALGRWGGDIVAFYGVEANRRLFRRFAEDYLVEKTASGSRFTWTVAMEPTAKNRLVLKITNPMNQFLYRALPWRAKAYFAKHP